jgi:transposase
MPSQSGKQHRFMEMVAHDPAAAKRVGVSQSVGKDFVEADKAEGKSFKGPTKEERNRKALYTKGK